MMPRQDLLARIRLIHWKLAVAALAVLPAAPGLAHDAQTAHTPTTSQSPASDTNGNSSPAPTASPAPKPVTQKEPTAEDVATTPLSDLNIKKDKIPPVLLSAHDHPYASPGTTSCARLSASVRELDAVLGPDFDAGEKPGHKLSAGHVAQSAVGSLIPFRSIIREISGANAEQRRLQEIVEAGMVRRAYLKGLGQARGCRRPARPE